MSSTSEETQDDMPQALDTPPLGSTPANVRELAAYQESSGAVIKPCSGSPSQQKHGTIIKGKKRSRDELKNTDAPNTAEDEQHSSQSAFQQCHAHSKHSTAHHVCTLPHSSNQHALQALLSAAQRHEATHQLSSSQQLHSEADGPSHLHDSSNPQLLRQRLPKSVAVRADKPYQVDNMQGQPWPSQLTLQSPPPMPQHNMMGDASQLDAMYAPTKPKAKISPQLIRDLQRLETPEMEADSVQAALEFAEAVRVPPAQRAQQGSDAMHPTFGQPHDTEPVRLFHAIEVGTGSLNVLRILTHRICNSTSSDFSSVTGGPEQLLEVIQDLLKDMEVSQQLLHHAEQAVIVHSQAAMQRVETLQMHHRATREYWLQSQRLQTISSDRQAVLQRMLMLPLEPASKDLLELFDRLQQNVVGLLEVSACRAKLTGDMQMAQAQLVAQGVSGVTPKGMMTGQVELVVERPVRRLQTLLSIIRAIISKRNVLLLELASALVPWHRCSQHMQQDAHKLAEAVSQIQGRIEGLLKPEWKGQVWHKGQPPSQPGQQHFAMGKKSPFEGTAAALGNSSQPGKTPAKSEQPSSLEAHRLQETPSGSQSTAGGSPGSALPLHPIKGRLSTQSNSMQLLSSCQDVSGSLPLHNLQTSAQAGRQVQLQEYAVVKPKAQQPLGHQSESSRDPRAQHSALHGAKAPLGSAQSLPLQQKQRPPVTPEPALPAHAVQSRPETDTETCGSPDVRAAAEALLQAQLQEIGIPSDQIHPQLLNLISALAGVSSGTSSTVSANTDPRASPHEPIVVTQQSGRAASEPVQEIAKVPKLSRHDSVRRQRGSVVCQDGSECMHGGPLEGAPVTRGNVTDFEQKQSHHERQHHQHDGQLQAAAYAQQLYALLVQAQCPQAAGLHLLMRAQTSDEAAACTAINGKAAQSPAGAK
ncbi:TPA: hypothetical protein ACH3X2_008927 [Trebouxia sp. C0005]